MTAQILIYRDRSVAFYAEDLVESRDVAVGFYEKLGYKVTDRNVIHGETYDCIRMEKRL